MNATMDLGSQKMETTNNSFSDMTLSIRGVDADGVATAKNKFERIITETKVLGVAIKYDSASQDDPSGAAVGIAELLQPLIKGEMSQKMDSLGNVSDVEFSDGMLEGIEANPLMSQLFNENSIKAMSANSTLVFPKKKMNVGDKWETETEIDLGGAKVHNKTNYEYLGVSEKSGEPLHVIRGKVSIEFPDGIQGADVKVLDEDSVVLLYFDGKKGRLVRSELDQKVKMEISAERQTVSQILNQKLTVELNEKK